MIITWLILGAWFGGWTIYSLFFWHGADQPSWFQSPFNRRARWEIPEGDHLVYKNGRWKRF